MCIRDRSRTDHQDYIYTCPAPTTILRENDMIYLATKEAAIEELKRKKKKHSNLTRLRALQEDPDDKDEDEDEEQEEEVGKAVPAVDKKVLAVVKKSTQHIKPQQEDSALADRGVIYLGHIPFGFFEDEMRGFFSQFGAVTRLRLSRSKKTGRSKGYAFVEFSHAEVAEVVAKVMHGYLLFGRVLASRVVPSEEQHETLWRGANKKFKITPWRKLAREQMNKPKSKEQAAKSLHRKKANQKKKRKNTQSKLKDLGVDYKFP
eukprot:TRINITY_DN4420_c0_g1_i3.p1 TRINITY_DN4420_c0_g1~~TRINITY_DN4420_c0_g1_i3.p1  ORF type:complete len:261 (-),score=110.33 TRINITY_DN4420_c0_g1_i3:63-845(-)